LEALWCLGHGAYLDPCPNFVVLSSTGGDEPSRAADALHGPQRLFHPAEVVELLSGDDHRADIPAIGSKVMHVAPVLAVDGGRQYPGNLHNLGGDEVGGSPVSVVSDGFHGRHVLPSLCDLERL